MATDQAIMEAVGEGRVPPTLRLYAWMPACLSLGYAQSAREADLDRIGARGWELVRRPTGGRAILHVDELTYSISLPQDHALVEGDITTSYQRLSAALHHALMLMGANPRAERHEQPAALNPICFETPSDYEITVNGKKIIGSAQVRRHKAVLQHGTLPLSGDITRICDALHYPDALSREAARETVRARAVTLRDALGYTVNWEQAANAFIRAFNEVFDLDLIPDSLTPGESLRLEQLRAEMYDNPAWIQRR